MHECCVCDGPCKIIMMFEAYGNPSGWYITEGNRPSADIRSRPWSVSIFHNAREIAVQVSFENPDLKAVSTKHIDIDFANPQTMIYGWLIDKIRALQNQCLDPMELKL